MILRNGSRRWFTTAQVGLYLSRGNRSLLGQELSDLGNAYFVRCLVDQNTRCETCQQGNARRPASCPYQRNCGQSCPRPHCTSELTIYELRVVTSFVSFVKGLCKGNDGYNH